MASPDGDRAVALSALLARAHHLLRRQIQEIRADLGQRRLKDDVLATHCLAFCAALTTHHRGEDAGMFSELLRVRPDLAGTIEKLLEDHALITEILSHVSELANRAEASRGQTLEAIGRELDGLAAIMESHFGYEERAIGRALDGAVFDSAVLDADWSGAVFRFDAAL